MSATAGVPYRIFVSSVQKELAQERRAVQSFVESDPLLQRFFSVFLFEDLPARDQRPDTAYLEEVDRCDVYLGILGLEYGFDEELAGIAGTQVYQSSAKGTEIPTVASAGTDPVAGTGVRLTIDRDLQWVAQSAIAEKVKEARADSGRKAR